MNMQYSVLILLFVAHYLFDFIFQERKDAENKSSDVFRLLHHALWYSIYTLLFIAVVLQGIMNISISANDVICYTAYLFSAHTLTDFITSKLSAYAHRTGQNKLFWSIIGIDQLLHQIQIIILFNLFIMR